MSSSTVELVQRQRAVTQREFMAGTELFMGRSLYNRFDHIYLGGDTGMLTVGGARGGKGRSCSIPNLLYWPHSAWVIDVKGTHAAVTSRYRREVLGQDVYIVDPFGVLGRGTDGFEPLRIDPDAPDSREQVNVRADAMVVPTPGTKDPHWDDGARTVVAGLIGHLVSGKYDKPTLPMIRDLLRKTGDEQKDLLAEMAVNDRAGGTARDAAIRIIRGYDTDEILGLLSNSDKHTEWLSSEALQKVFSNPTFSFAQLKEKPTTIYLVIPPHYLEIHKRFLRLFINLAINQMSIGGRSRIPVLGIIDEYLSCGYMAETLRAFSLLQGYNLMLWPFIQDLQSARALIGDGLNAIINNCRAVQVFAASDEETTGFASGRIGPRSSRYVVGEKGSTSVPLRNPTEVSYEVSADGGLQYILRAGNPHPLLLKKVIYYEDRLAWKNTASMPEWLMRRLYPFWGKYDPDPDYN